MKEYRVYQNRTVRENSEKINLLGWTAASLRIPGVLAHLECSLEGSKNWLPEWFENYTHVATAKAENLDGVFRDMNLWPDDIENRVSVVYQCSSLSVGDILIDSESGEAFMVDPYGFSKIEVI